MLTGLKMDTQIGIKPENRESVAHLLNTVLSNEFILYTKTRRAHPVILLEDCLYGK
jgi:DNA-binding ferritin-like protein